MNINIKLGLLFLFWTCFFMVLSHFNEITPSLNITEYYWSSLENYKNIKEVPSDIKSNEELEDEHGNIRGYLKQLNTFYKYESVSKINGLLLTSLKYATDALMIVPLVTHFGFLLNNINRKLIKSSMPHAVSVFQGIMIIEILNLITSPVVGKIDVPPYRRREKFHNINMWRDEIYRKYLSESFNATTALKILQSYNLLSKIKMENLAKKIIEHTQLDEFYDKCRVNDSNLNEKLRFHEYVEVSLTEEQAVERIYNIYSSDDINLINLPIEKLFEEYLNNDLFDTVSFDNYYAIQNFLTNDYMTTNLQIPSLWRIRKAMYSLALRQYDSLPTKRQVTLHCIPKSNYQGIIHHGIITFNEFVFCDKVRAEIFFASLRTRPFTTRFYRIQEIVMPYLPVSLNIVDKELKQYVILPGSKFQVMNDNFVVVNGYKRHYNTLKSVKISRCEWLSSVANMASKYAAMDAEYIPDSEEGQHL